jgi:hypothetical protein
MESSKTAEYLAQIAPDPSVFDYVGSLYAKNEGQFGSAMNWIMFASSAAGTFATSFYRAEFLVDDIASATFSASLGDLTMATIPYGARTLVIASVGKSLDGSEAIAPLTVASSVSQFIYGVAF